MQIASVSGRFYAMDRTKKWDRLEQAYNLLVLGEGLKAKSGEEAIVQAYNRQETDEYVRPTVIVKNGQPVATVDGNDLVIFMNLRSDRARELTKAFTQREFNKNNIGSFHRKKWSDKLFFIALTDFGPDLDLVRTAYPSRVILNSLPFLLKDYHQLYISEEEKFAHVTFFFNGGYDHPAAAEDRVLIPSVQVQSYDLKPEMSAGNITKYLISNIGNYDFVTVNFANQDMLGHTGNLRATIKGLEFVDKCLNKLINRVLQLDGTAIITADHGNAEEMINLKTGEIDTEHSTNLVPFILVGHNYKKVKLAPTGALGDVAPTILDLKNVAKPSDIKGKSLIIGSHGKN